MQFTTQIDMFTARIDVFKITPGPENGPAEAKMITALAWNISSAPS